MGPFTKACLENIKQLIHSIKRREERLLYLDGKPHKTKDEQEELDKATADYDDDDYDY